ncbi:MAG: hypothetical protein IJ347_06320 [Faecalibacterium sp.]|nr:hypothetical protein [Faecalibacterium sp.]
MMKLFAGVLLLAAGVLASVARWLDLVNFTDLQTGFVTAGSVWVRYAVLLLLVLLAALGGRMAAARPHRVERRAVLLALLAFAGCAAFAVAGGLQLVSGGGALAALLSLITGWWLASLGIAWISKKGNAPALGVGSAIAGTALFFVLTLQRFVQNYSSYHRVGPALSVFSALAALWFAAALVRSTLFPQTDNGQRLAFAGLTAFYLCTCLELPQALCLWLAGQTTLVPLLQSGALAVLGLLGAGCALTAFGRQPDEQPVEQTGAKRAE